MRKKFLFYCLLFTVYYSLLLLPGCISMEAARYSPDEIKDFPPAIQEHIKSGEIVTGMTQQQVRFAWGSPNVINVLKPTDEGKYREEWVYTRTVVFKTKLIFIDGKLTHIITNEPGIIKK